MADDGLDPKSQKKTVKHDSGAADLERVTDYAEEKEISSDITGVSMWLRRATFVDIFPFCLFTVSMLHISFIANCEVFMVTITIIACCHIPILPVIWRRSMNGDD